MPITKLALRQVLIADKRAGNRLDRRIANPEFIVDSRARMYLSIVGEDEQIGAARSEQVPKMRDERRQRGLQAGGIKLVRPPIAIGSIESIGISGTECGEVARSAKIIHRHSHIKSEVGTGGREIQGPDKSAAAQAGDVIHRHVPAIQRAGRGQMTEGTLIYVKFRVERRA